MRYNYVSHTSLPALSSDLVVHPAEIRQERPNLKIAVLVSAGNKRNPLEHSGADGSEQISYAASRMSAVIDLIWTSPRHTQAITIDKWLSRLALQIGIGKTKMSLVGLRTGSNEN